MKSIRYIIALLFFSVNTLFSQISKTETNFLSSDTLGQQTFISAKKKTLSNSFDSLNKPKFKPDPMKVVWMGAIIPGYGQIMNRSYWKVPIVYAGFLGFAYLINRNSRSYESYKQAYKDIIDTNDNTNSFLDILPKGYTLDTYPGGKSGYETNLSSYFEQSRRNRDLSIILAVAYYGITLIEAYVDAQLFDFDISTDLSMHIRPNLINTNLGTNKTLGLQLSLNLK